MADKVILWMHTAKTDTEKKIINCFCGKVTGMWVIISMRKLISQTIFRGCDKVCEYRSVWCWSCQISLGDVSRNDVCQENFREYLWPVTTYTSRACHLCHVVSGFLPGIQSLSRVSTVETTQKWSWIKAHSGARAALPPKQKLSRRWTHCSCWSLFKTDLAKKYQSAACLLPFKDFK